MIKPGIVSFKCLSWNIAGKYEILKSKIMQDFIERYFKIFEFPDTKCNYEHPRGGICTIIKKDKIQYIKNVMEIEFENGLTMVNLYIPPVDSVYYDEQYVQLMCSEFYEADVNKTPILSMGDTNTRLGDLSDIQEGHCYSNNPDTKTNENGRHLREVLFATSSATPVNHLINDQQKFDGGFIFHRNDKKSQIDWCFSNKHGLSYIKSFNLVRDCPNISDHKPIVVDLEISGEKSISHLVKASQELNTLHQNHSKIPRINTENTNLECVQHLLHHAVE